MVMVDCRGDGTFIVSRVFTSLPAARDAMKALAEINPARYGHAEPAIPAEPTGSNARRPE